MNQALRHPRRPSPHVPQGRRDSVATTGSTSTDQSLQVSQPDDNNVALTPPIINQPYNNWGTSLQYSSDSTAPPPFQTQPLSDNSAHGPFNTHADPLSLPAYPDPQQFSTNLPPHQSLYQHPTQLLPQDDNYLSSTQTSTSLWGLPSDTQASHNGQYVRCNSEEHKLNW